MYINCVKCKMVLRNNYRVMERADEYNSVGMKLRYCRNKCQYFFHTGINYTVNSWNLQGGVLNKIAGKLELHSHKSHKMGIPRELANVIFHLFFFRHSFHIQVREMEICEYQTVCHIVKIQYEQFYAAIKSNCALEWEYLKCT